MTLMIIVVSLFVFFFFIDVCLYEFSNDWTLWVVNKYKKFKRGQVDVYDEHKLAAAAEESAMYLSPEDGPQFDARGNKVFQLKKETEKEYLNK
jgi:hypothetical protein